MFLTKRNRSFYNNLCLPFKVYRGFQIDYLACQSRFTASILKGGRFTDLKEKNFATQSSSGTTNRQRLSFCDCSFALERFFDIEIG
jgi:hypothetical protein